MTATDALIVLRAGALVLLAVGSGLVLRLVTLADTSHEASRPKRPRREGPPPDTMRRAA